MSELWRDALFAVDGTELPVSAPERSDSDRERDAPWLSLPLIPPLSMTREEIAATLGEDPGGPADQGSTAAPASPPAPSAPQSSSAPTDPTAVQPAPPAAAPPRLTRPVISAAPLPSQPRSGGLGALRYPSRLAARSRPRVQRRRPGRAGRSSRGLQTRTRSNGGAGAFFLIMVITFAVLLYFIISGIVESFARLFS